MLFHLKLFCRVALHGCYGDELFLPVLLGLERNSDLFEILAFSIAGDQRGGAGQILLIGMAAHQT